MAAYENGDSEQGSRLFDKLFSRSCHESFFADDVLPAMRQAGLHQEVEKFWQLAKRAYCRTLLLFPEAHNSYNTAAWVASRAACDLDDAVIWIEKALERQPNTSAYLDTKAEVFFARGEREEAMQWSEKACQKSGDGGTLAMLRVQYRHFRDDPFPATRSEEVLEPPIFEFEGATKEE